jgi:hypothetical protein
LAVARDIHQTSPGQKSQMVRRGSPGKHPGPRPRFELPENTQIEASTTLASPASPAHRALSATPDHRFTP